MYSKIADLYRAVGISVTPEMLAGRTLGIDAFAKDASYTKIAGAVSYLKGNPSTAFVDALKVTMREKDTSFGDSGSEHELSVLAAGYCLELTERPRFSQEGLFASLLIVCGLREAKAGLLEKFLISEAKAILRIRSQELRKDLLSSEFAVELPKKDATFDPADLKTRFTAIAKAVGGWSEVFTVLSDESNLLWWLMGQEAQIPGKAISVLEAGELPFWVGKELAEAVSALPGPEKMEAIIARAMQSNQNSGDTKTRNLQGMTAKVNATEVGKLAATFVQQCGNDIEVLKQLLPVHATVQRLHESGTGGWKQPLTQSGDFEYLEALSPKKFAYQVYLESLALKALNS